MRNDWLPGNHAGFYHEVNLMTNYILATANRERMGFGTTTPRGKWYVEVVLPFVNNYKEAYQDWEDETERTPLKISRLERAQKELTKILRELAALLKRDVVLVTEDDLQAMGLPSRVPASPKPTPIAPVAPSVLADTSVICRIKFRFGSINSEGKVKKGKPAGQHGAEIRWVISDVPVILYEDLLHSAFDTNSPFELEFRGDERGKMVYYALRWENTRGQKGPWSPIYTVIVP